MKRYSFILLIAIQLFYTTGAQAQWNSPNRYKAPVFLASQIVMLANQEYTKVTDIRNQQVSLHLNVGFPAKMQDGVKKRPLIVMVHGGAFADYDKSLYNARALQLAQMGYVVATIDYRLYNSATYAGNANLGNYLTDLQGHVNNNSQLPWYVAVQDLRAAVKYLCYNSTTYGIDPDNVFLFGESAGAMTCLTFAVAQQAEINTYFNFSANTLVGDLDYATLPLYRSQTYTIRGVAPIAGALPYNTFLTAADKMPLLMENNVYDCISTPNGDSRHRQPMGLFAVGIMQNIRGWVASGISYPCSYLFLTYDGTYDFGFSADNNCNIVSGPVNAYHTLTDNGWNNLMGPLTATFFASILSHNPTCLRDDLTTLYHCQRYTSIGGGAAKIGFTDTQTPELSVYPNPVTDNLTVNGLAEQSAVDITVYDALGSLIKTYSVQTEAEEHSTSLSLDGLAAGMYYIRVKDALNDKQFKLLKQY